MFHNTYLRQRSGVTSHLFFLLSLPVKKKSLPVEKKVDRYRKKTTGREKSQPVEFITHQVKFFLNRETCSLFSQQGDFYLNRLRFFSI